MISPKEVRDFQKKILSWFAKNKRDLPWRKSRDPYNILISEVMLQQTQVPRVIPKYNEWIKKFPTIQSLAKATTRDVLSLWSGLGYNRRALYLQKTAQEIVEKYHGKFPEDEKQLQSLPGIGEYTARAVLCFAFDKQIAVIDTNIKKVIAIHFCKGKVPQKKKLQEIADKILPQGKAYTWNQALMDYASAELKKEKIAIPKQSKFKDSDRYYRGQMLKLLLRKKKVAKKMLVKEFSGIEKERLEKIISVLKKESLVQEEKKEEYTI